MRTILRVVVSILMLMVGAAALPAAAAEGLQPAVVTPSTAAGYAEPAAFNTGIRNITLGEVAAILGGAAIVGTAADMTFSGGVFTILGVVAGAALGSEWYERRMWPF
jgi:hypothetical protein